MPETNFFTPTQDNDLPAGLPVPVYSGRSASPAGRPAGGKKTRKKSVGRKKSDKPSLKKNFDAGQESGVEPKTNGNSPAKKSYFKIAFSFVILTVIMASAVMYFGFAKASLIIIPTQEKISDSMNLEVVDQTNNPALGQGQILGVVKQAPLEQSRAFSSSGKEILGQEVSGKVTIINNYMKNQPLVATTRLLAPDNKLFRLRNTVNVPAGGRVEAEIYADEARPDMAIGASKFTIPGLWAGLQDKIYAQSSQPMRYSEKIKYTIKQSDIDKAVGELKQDFLANGKKEIARAYSEYDQSILEIDNNSISQEVGGKVGEEKDKFTIKMKAKVTVVAFKSEDMYRQAQAKLANALADDREIVDFSRPDTAYSLSSLDLNQGTVAVKINFAVKVTLKDSAGAIKKNNLVGLDEKRLKAYLNSLPEVAGYEIKFSPAFWKKMPKLADRIEVVIKR